MMKRKRSVAIGIVCLVLAGITACTGQQKLTSELHSFNSIDEAFAAVDDVLECNPQPVGDPVVPMSDGVKLVSAQRLCSEHVQVDLYPDQESVEKSYKILAGSRQGDINIVRGSNWMVVDFSAVASGSPSTKNIERLSTKLRSEYSVVGA
ncbi:hypothetical protein ACFUOZ_05900 [Paenarthrobacter sp. NPDC057355]|uniref:hypothetical protein n=1 Tax=Paenarthrobacter sp. NPDC057355 TaxID=3346105 RepID=UPI0036459FE3